MKITIFENNEARILLSNPDFLEAWEKLCGHCSWATVFQSVAFVSTWYKNFPNYPCLIISDWDNGNMTGLLTLTRDGKSLVAAGTNLAEYQVWIESADSENRFIMGALKAIQTRFPGQTLKLKYLPPATPISFFQTADWSKKVILKPYEMPLMRLDKDQLQSELKKKNRKEKLNRLNRIGDLQFKVIQEKHGFDKAINEMCVQSDFRKGAMYNKIAFKEEPQRKNFLLDLYDLGLIHLSLFTLNQELIASNAGIVGKDMVHLQGINSHSPFYAKHSPGILHFLQLGIALADEGFSFFDLTPGGAGGYKEMLASEQKLAWELIMLSPPKIALSKVIEVTKKTFLTGLAKTRLAGNSSDFKSLWLDKKNKGKLFLKNPSKLFRSDGMNKIWSNQPKKYFSFNTAVKGSFQGEFNIAQNELKDFLDYNEKGSLITRWEFLSDCMKRIELGHIPFTIKENGELVAVFWEIPINAKSGENKVDKYDKTTFTYSYYKEDFHGHLLGIANHLISSLIDAEKLTLPYDFQVTSGQKHLLYKLKNQETQLL